MGASVADYEYDCCEATATSLAATHLAGFNGELMPFTLCTLPDAETDRLPTSSTCFNKVYLPRYATAEVLLSLIEDSKTATEEIE